MAQLVDVSVSAPRGEGGDLWSTSSSSFSSTFNRIWCGRAQTLSPVASQLFKARRSSEVLDVAPDLGALTMLPKEDLRNKIQQATGHYKTPWQRIKTHRG